MNYSNNLNVNFIISIKSIIYLYIHYDIIFNLKNKLFKYLYNYY